MPKRTRLAKGIYEDLYGRSIIVWQNGKPHETTYDKHHPLDELKRIRKRLTENLKDHPIPERVRGSLARDAVTFLKTRKGRPNYKTEKTNLRAWIAALQNPPRWRITAQDLAEVIALWREEEYAEQTLRHRYNILRALFQHFDGKRARSPFDDVPIPKKTRPRPVSVSEETIKTVAANLLHQESINRLHDSKTRARFLVLATHTQRPSELKRTRREDLDLDRRMWTVRSGKGGYNVIVPLNNEQLAAWRIFIAAEAFGDYDTRSFCKTLQRNGWPKAIRPYNLRHSTGFAMSARGFDLGDIQTLFGHTSPETTRIYVPGQFPRLQQANEKLVGRFGPEMFAPARSVLPPCTSPMSGSGQDEKTSDFIGVYKSGKSRTRRPNPTITVAKKA